MLLEIIIDAVNAARRQEDPHANGMVMRITPPLRWDNKIISPLDTKTIFDEGKFRATITDTEFSDLMTPAMTLYLPPELASENYSLPRGPYQDAFKAEMVLQMKLHSKLSFQGIYFDGVMARVSFAKVDHSDDVFAKHRTDFATATYLMPA
jgi:hypothetical protein